MQRTVSGAFLTGLCLACAPATGQTLHSGGTDGGHVILNSRFLPGGGCTSIKPGIAELQAGASSRYIAAGARPGKAALLQDDFTCDTNALSGAHGGTCSGPAGAAGNTVDFAAPDTPLTNDEIAGWSGGTFGQKAAGNLIQLPMMGAGAAIGVNNAAINGNGAATLSDGDLCGVFSGRIKDSSQITDSAVKLAPGPFKLVYRADEAGVTYWLTTHLAAVCTAREPIVFKPTASFASLFPAGTPPSFVPAIRENGVAAALAGCSAAGPMPNAFGALLPSLTTLVAATKNRITCANGTQRSSPILVAGLGAAGKAVLPTTTAIAAGLANPASGSNLSPPASAAQATQPANWMPAIATVRAGYPIVGYIAADLPQCSASQATASTIAKRFRSFYSVGSACPAVTSGGFVPLQKLDAGNGYLSAINANLLADTNGWNTDVDNSTACAGLPGR